MSSLNSSTQSMDFRKLPIYSFKTHTCRGFVHLKQLNELSENEHKNPEKWPECILEINLECDLNENYALNVVTSDEQTGAKKITRHSLIRSVVKESPNNQQVFEFHPQNKEQSFAVWVISNRIRDNWVSTITMVITAAEHRAASQRLVTTSCKRKFLSIQRHCLQILMKMCTCHSSQKRLTAKTTILTNIPQTTEPMGTRTQSESSQTLCFLLWTGLWRRLWKTMEVNLAQVKVTLVGALSQPPKAQSKPLVSQATNPRPPVMAAHTVLPNNTINHLTV